MKQQSQQKPAPAPSPAPSPAPAPASTPKQQKPARSKLEHQRDSEIGMLQRFIDANDGNGFDLRVEKLRYSVRVISMNVDEMKAFMVSARQRFDLEESCRQAALEDLQLTLANRTAVMDTVEKLVLGLGAKLNRKRA